MNKYFNLTDKVYDITEKYPETIEILALNGFENLKNEMMRKTLGKTITLETALKSKKINPELFAEKMAEAIEQNHPSLSSGLAQIKKDSSGDIKIEGILPCPIRIPLVEAFEKWLGENSASLGFEADYDLKSANLGVDWIKERIIANKGNADVLSDLFLSAGFDLFFDKELMGKFKEEGIFEDITGVQKLNKDFDNDYIDLKDPKGQYSVIGIVPAIFMVNTKVLGDRKFPESWEDLLSGEFENTVSLPMKDLDLFNAVLLNIYKLYGEEGIEKLGKTLLRSMHPAQMVKSHTRTDEGETPVITVMPYFFTQMIDEKGPFKPVWPKDGAIISPVFLLTKKATKDKTKPFVDFLFSKEIGEIFSVNGKFPSTNPQVENNIPEDKKFMWLGWDFINNNDIGSLLKYTESLFYDASRKEI